MGVDLTSAAGRTLFSGGLLSWNAPTPVMLSEGRPTKEEGRSRNIHEIIQATNLHQGVLSGHAVNHPEATQDENPQSLSC
jgi:hypothetical protein